jgi:hypothetical protein
MEVIGEVWARHPAQELVRSAEAHHADLIVVGQSGPPPGRCGDENPFPESDARTWTRSPYR